jgi:uncharacterized protein YecE (DUF72 family)
MKVYIGCSGYHYPSWKKAFYPEDLPKDQWLEYYAKHFNTVEINNTFYKMPTEFAFQEWRDKTPANFKFTVKANRYFTHLKKLNIDAGFRERLQSFNKTISVLEDQLGCVLWQLPGNLHRDVDKLENLCKMLDKNMRHVIEFRHPSWFNEKIYDVLSAQDVSLCILSAPNHLPEEVRATNKTAYLRLHGKDSWYDYHYTDQELKNWEKQLKKLKQPGQLYVYFNNDQYAFAPDNAKTFASFLINNNTKKGTLWHSI